MLRKLIRKIVKEELEAGTIKDSPGLPIGYNPLELIRGGLFHWVQVPFNSTPVWCELRCINAAQMESLGNMTSIIEAGKERKLTREELNTIRNYQEKIVEAVLNKPTFDEIGSLVHKYDFVLSKKRQELKEIEKYYETNKEKMTPAEGVQIEKKIEAINLFLGYILPMDTMAFLTSWGMGNDVSDIQKITRNQFIEAASLAKLANKAPSDYLSGIFTDHNKHEIDKHAWSVYADYLESKAHEKTLQIGGPKRG